MTTLSGVIQNKLVVNIKCFPWGQATVESGGTRGGRVVLFDIVQLTDSICLGTAVEASK